MQVNPTNNGSVSQTVNAINLGKGSKKKKQAGAELCQAQVKLGVIVYIGVKLEVKIVVEVWIQLLARVMEIMENMKFLKTFNI